VAGEIPAGSESVFHFLDIFALGFGLLAVDSFGAGKPAWETGGYVAAAAAIHIIGTKLPRISRILGSNIRSALNMIITILSACFVVYAVFSGVFYVLRLRSDLDAFVIPRTLTDEQREAIRAVLSQHDDPHADINVFASQLDPEAVEYAATLFNAIKDSGWTVRFGNLNPLDTAPNPNLDKYKNTFFPAYLAVDGGVNIRVGYPGQPSNSDPKNLRPDELLGKAFSAARIQHGGGGGANQSGYFVIIAVGRRPLAIRDVPWRFKVAGWLARGPF
jgi:hypothetical protein